MTIDVNNKIFIIDGRHIANFTACWITVAISQIMFLVSRHFLDRHFLGHQNLTFYRFLPGSSLPGPSVPGFSIVLAAFCQFQWSRNWRSRKCHVAHVSGICFYHLRQMKRVAECVDFWQHKHQRQWFMLSWPVECIIATPSYTVSVDLQFVSDRYRMCFMLPHDWLWIKRKFERHSWWIALAACATADWIQDVCVCLQVPAWKGTCLLIRDVYSISSLSNSWTTSNLTFFSTRRPGYSSLQNNKIRSKKFLAPGPALWNSLPQTVRDPCLSLSQFWSRHKTFWDDRSRFVHYDDYAIAILSVCLSVRLFATLVICDTPFNRSKQSWCRWKAPKF